MANEITNIQIQSSKESCDAQTNSSSVNFCLKVKEQPSASIVDTI